MASVSWVMSAAAPARSGLINPAGLPGPEIQEEPLLAGYVTFCIDFCHISFIIESIGHPSFSPEKAGLFAEKRQPQRFIFSFAAEGRFCYVHLFHDRGRASAELPICKVTDDLYIGAFICFGDAELTEACGRELLKLLEPGSYDYLFTAEAKSIPLIHEMARQSGAKKYFIARKGPKAYMPRPHPCGGSSPSPLPAPRSCIWAGMTRT